MRKEAIDKNFANYINSDCMKPIFHSVLKDVRKDFLEATDLTTLTGVPFVAVCLLFAHAVDRLTAGYTGASNYNSDLLYEAIGIGAFYWGGNPRMSPGTRYGSLVLAVRQALITKNEFRAFCDSFIAYDSRNGNS